MYGYSIYMDIVYVWISYMYGYSICMDIVYVWI